MLVQVTSLRNRQHFRISSSKRQLERVKGALSGTSTCVWRQFDDLLRVFRIRFILDKELPHLILPGDGRLAAGRFGLGDG